MMAKIIARHEAALQLLEADRSWILFMEAGELGIIPQLMQTTATWKKSRTQGTCKCLRQALMGALLMELAARLQKLEADAPAQQRLSKAKLLSTEPLAWHYEVEPGQAISRAHRGRTPPARQRHQVHAGTHGAHGQGRGDTRISCARWDGSGQGQDHNVQTHTVDGGEEAADSGSTYCPFRLGSPEAHRSETATRKISSLATQGAPSNDPGRRAVSASSQRGEPSSATNGNIAAPHTEMRQTIFTLGRVKQIESLPPGLSQRDLHRVDAKKGKPKSGPSRSGESKDAQSASGSRGDQPTITSWMVQPKPSGDGQNDRKRGASQSDVARQTHHCLT